MSNRTFGLVLATIILLELGFLGVVDKWMWGKPIVVVNNPDELQLEGEFLRPSTEIFSDQTAAVNSTSTSISTPVARFSDSFGTPYRLKETSQPNSNLSKNWWVNSGGYFITEGGVAKTIQGDVPSSDEWYKKYASSNALDTDNGSHPQNIFRLVQTQKWENFSQQVYFKINSIIMSKSPNRNASNGVLLFNRYHSGDNLYYTGVRVDGAAVIKKKINGTYYTMSLKNIFPAKSYNPTTNLNSIPLTTWIGIKSEVITNLDKSVTIKLYTDIGKEGVWTLAAEVKDNGITFGGTALLDKGYAGIRTDFMNVEFDDYSIVSI
ncbi:MAG: hypothetical protein M3Q63_03520 [bacterium]|nr:hypothetical protein [bacterium]